MWPTECLCLLSPGPLVFHCVNLSPTDLGATPWWITTSLPCLLAYYWEWDSSSKGVPRQICLQTTFRTYAALEPLWWYIAMKALVGVCVCKTHMLTYTIYFSKSVDFLVFFFSLIFLGLNQSYCPQFNAHYHDGSKQDPFPICMCVCVCVCLFIYLCIHLLSPLPFLCPHHGHSFWCIIMKCVLCLLLACYFNVYKWYWIIDFILPLSDFLLGAVCDGPICVTSNCFPVCCGVPPPHFTYPWPPTSSIINRPLTTIFLPVHLWTRLIISRRAELLSRKGNP